ncbi:MAG: hypothetical protein OEM79_01095 [Nitrosopumilus sp.]|nr:hypothetical protein [Nitrosopumilus sp.]
MKFKNSQIDLKPRRGLSSIVGALLFVVLMVAAFAVVGVALNSQTEIVETSRDVTQFGIERNAEAFDLTSISQPAGQFLDVNLINQGPNAAEMFTMVMTNKSDAGQPTRTFEIPSSTSFLPPGADSPTDIVDTLNINMTIPGAGIIESYDFKVISSLGTIKKLSVECNGDTGTCGPVTGPVGAGALDSELFLDGPTAVNGHTTTIIMFIQNTGDESVYDVEPKELCADMWTTTGSGNFSPCALTPTPPIPELAAGAVAIFKWDGTVLCDIGDTFTMTNGVKGNDSPGGSPVTPSTDDSDSVECIDPNDCGPGGCGPGGDEGGPSIILIDDLLIKPSLFLTIPSPFGSVPSAGSADDDLGVWGVQVANPLNFTIGVTKVTITAFAPGANSNLKIFDPSTESHNVSPRFSGVADDNGSWINDAENVLVWKNFTDPIILTPYSAETFMFKANPWTNSVDLEAIIVQTSIFSTSGSFGKAAYQTTMFPAGGSADAPISNVYLSTTVDSRDSADIRGHVNGLKNGTSHEFVVVMADMDDNDGSYMAQDTEFIINVPRLWGLPVINDAKTTNVYKNATEPQIIPHSDGSYQIIGLLNQTIGSAGNPDTATITFNSTAPEEKTERLYIMYVLGNGITNAGESVGPLSEVVIHVIGNVTGYP